MHQEDMQQMGPQGQQQRGYKGHHPMAAFFHVIFKIAALFAYFFGNMLTSSYIGTFIACVLFNAVDFWVVKNVSGRLLAGLRWWNRIEEDGSSSWVFESATNPPPQFDIYFFWMTTFATVVVWGACTLFTLTTFQWIPITVLGLALALANAGGYGKCRKDARRRFAQMAAQAAMNNPDVMRTAANAAFRSGGAAV